MITLILLMTLMVKAIDLEKAPAPTPAPVITTEEVFTLKTADVCSKTIKQTPIIKKACVAYKQADAAIAEQVRLKKLDARTAKALMKDDWYEAYLRFVVKTSDQQLDEYREHKALRNDSLVNSE